MADVFRTTTSQGIDTILKHAMQTCVLDGLSFALWKLPNRPAIHFAAASETTLLKEVNLEDISSGFLFAPFDPHDEKIFLPAHELFVVEEGNVTSVNGSLLQRASSKSNLVNVPTCHQRPMRPAKSASPGDFRELVKLCRRAVLEGNFEKIVPSRCKEVDVSSGFDVDNVFLQLCSKYPSAMVSVMSSPETGTWIGATPEMLVAVDSKQRFRTVAVAGTQPYLPGTDPKSITWTQKEIEEQALVERYIIGCFKQIRLREFDEHGPKTVVAGNVVHLKTEFEVDMAATHYPQLGSVMLKLLHPTSAVCGTPMEDSLNFLREHEGYPREFYSGFLGPVRIHQESHLFVNLRCLQLADGCARLYAGGGVLGDSDPEREWVETELKMNTLLTVIGTDL